MENPHKQELSVSPEQIIEGNLGKEYLEEAANISKSIFAEMKVRMQEIIASQGSSSQHQEEARKYLDMWKDFSNSVFVRTQDRNLRSPENLETAIKGATALMRPEPMREDDSHVQKMIKDLEKRYGKE